MASPKVCEFLTGVGPPVPVSQSLHGHASVSIYVRGCLIPVWTIRSMRSAQWMEAGVELRAAMFGRLGELV